MIESKLGHAKSKKSSVIEDTLNVKGIQQFLFMKKVVIRVDTGRFFKGGLFSSLDVKKT